MNLPNRALAGLILAALLLAATCSSSTDSDQSAPEPDATSAATPSATDSPEVTGGSETTDPTENDETTPPEVEAAEWVHPGFDYDNSRAPIGSRVDGSNLDQLTVAWTADLSGSLSTVPLIVDGRVYIQDGTGTITTLDAETGETIWASEPFGFNIGPFGVAVAEGRVFGLFESTGVVALDSSNGEELWRSELIATETTGIDIQPTVIDGMVLVSTVPVSLRGIYTGGDRGVLHALDAETGEVLWTFDTVESEDLWGNPDVNSGGGSWYPPSIDPDRGLVYWGVANPAPFPGTEEFPNGTSRPGPNLYTNSAVALDLESGQLEWFHQVIPHDIFDRDLVHTLIARPPDGDEIVVATGKGATVVGLTPGDGELLWETPVGLHQNDDLEALDGPTVVAPGTYGGVISPPATADGVVYVAVLNAPTELTPDAPAYFGATLGANDGEVAAIDATTGELLWATPVPGDPLGGVTVVNDVVFTTVLQGRILALDRTSGELLWQNELPGGTNGWMAVAGDQIIVPVGNADPPRLISYRLPASDD